MLVYPIVLLCILATSAFFSIHYLTCYYLLQPYNEATGTKSSTYGVVMGITYLVCFAFIYLRMDPIVFGGVMIIFSVLYAVIARIPGLSAGAFDLPAAPLKQRIVYRAGKRGGGEYVPEKRHREIFQHRADPDDRQVDE